MKRRSTPKLADLVGAALAPAMSRHGFATSELIARWAEIAGPRFSGVTRPLRVTWPRRPEEAPEGPPARGTLVVLCEGAHALDLQHEAPVLLERINVLYGWRAVERLAIRQGPVAARRAERPAGDAPVAPAGMQERLRAVADDELRRALGRLGGHVASSGRLTKP
jgi:hypothetical protein